MSLQFNPGSNAGVVDEMNDICSSDNTRFALTAKARRVNAALDRFFTLAFSAAKPGTVDDVNQTTVPVESINLVANTQSYALDSFSSELINYIRFESVDSSGNRILLNRLDREGVGEALTNYQSTAGTPREYDIVGGFIYLYPKPSFSYSNGLTAYFDRNKSAIASSDTTKSLGIPSTFSMYICRLASLQYLIDNQHPQKNDVATLIAQDERDILSYYASREKSVPKRMRANVENTR